MPCAGKDKRGWQTHGRERSAIAFYSAPRAQTLLGDAIPCLQMPLLACDPAARLAERGIHQRAGVVVWSRPWCAGVTTLVRTPRT